jgi:hypothetical protein
LQEIERRAHQGSLYYFYNFLLVPNYFKIKMYNNKKKKPQGGSLFQEALWQISVHDANNYALTPLDLVTWV